MKKIFLSFLFSFLLLVAFSQSYKKIKMDDVLKMIDTTQTPLIINFWATWCHPCVEEIPLFEKEIEQYKQQNAKLIFISVDFANDTATRLKTFLQLHQLASQVYWFDEKNPVALFHEINIHWVGKIPATLMINNAKHYHEFYNYGLVQYQMEAYLKDLIVR